MSAENWFIVQLLSAIVAAVLGLGAATVLFFESIASDTHVETVRSQLRGVLERLQNSPLSAFAENLLSAGSWLGAMQQRALDLILGKGSWVAGTLGAVACVLVVWNQFGKQWMYVAISPIALSVVLQIKPWRRFFHPFSRYMGDIGTMAFAAAGLLAFTQYAVSLDPPWLGVLLAFAASPVALVIADTILTFGDSPNSIVNTSPSKARAIYIGALGLGLSVIATVSALAIGQLSEPAVPNPRLSLQAVAANLVFDTLTLIVFAWLLRSARGASGIVSVLIVFTGCFAAAAVFAFASVWAAFFGTESELSVREMAHVFLGLSPRGEGIELGGYFFLMHTTFLPVLVFLIALAMAVIARLWLNFSANVLRTAAATHVHPYKATAALLAVFVALFAGISGVASVAKEGVREQSKSRGADSAHHRVSVEG
ncbi:MAG: hypothetical protein AB7S86_10395 [Hydrogenophaga sp.]|uniref:hypothetical protein n=1 Tax=Hydrogenophaga sp. TaxID=1904254 RepID=UPI003D103563